MTEEFAKYAKIQRRIDKFTAEIKRLGKNTVCVLILVQQNFSGNR